MLCGDLRVCRGVLIIQGLICDPFDIHRRSHRRALDDRSGKFGVIGMGGWQVETNAVSPPIEYEQVGIDCGKDVSCREASRQLPFDRVEAI